MPQPEKELKVGELNASLQDAKGVFLTDFTGLTVEEITRLRREFRKVDVEYIVVKNTLARRSAQNVGLEKIIPYLTGPTGLAISKADPIAPVRVIYDFKKGKEKPAIKSAFIEGQMLDQEAAEEMRNIPPRDVLLGQVVSGIAAPLSGLVGSLNALLTNLANVLDAIKDKKNS